MKTTTFRGHAATFARLFCLLKSRVESCFRRRRRRRRWRARSRRHRRTRHSIHIIFFLVVCYPKLFSVVVTHLSLKKQAKKNKKRAKKTKEEQTRDKKKSICQKKTQRKQDQRDHLIRKDLKVLSSEEGRAGHLISSLSVLKVVISSNDDAQPVCFNRKEEKAEGERKRRRC